MNPWASNLRFAWGSELMAGAGGLSLPGFPRFAECSLRSLITENGARSRCVQVLSPVGCAIGRYRPNVTFAPIGPSHAVCRGIGVRYASVVRLVHRSHRGSASGRSRERPRGRHGPHPWCHPRESGTERFGVRDVPRSSPDQPVTRRSGSNRFNSASRAPSVTRRSPRRHREREKRNEAFPHGPGAALPLPGVDRPVGLQQTNEDA